MMLDLPPVPPAVVRPAPVRFAPPLDRALRYETVEERAGRAGPLRFRVEYRVRFRRAGAGYWLEQTQVTHAAEAGPAVARVFDLAMAPFEGVTVTLGVTRDGAIGLPLDAAATWAKIVAANRQALAAAEARPDATPARLAAMRAVAGQLEATPPAERDARLGDWAAELLGFAAPDLIPGGDAPLTLGEGDAALSGRVRYRLADARLATFALDLASPAGVAPAIDRHDDAQVDRATGLIESLVSRRTVTAPGAPPMTTVTTLRRLPDTGR